MRTAHRMLCRTPIVYAAASLVLFLVRSASAGQGELDPTFGGTGVVTTPIGSVAAAEALVLQPDGRLVAAGFALTDGIQGATLVRYGADGALDATFGAGGIVMTPLATFAHGLVRQPDGKLVAAGEHIVAGAADVVLLRYNADGTPDETFGTGGQVTTDLGGQETAQAIVLQPDGKLVVAGSKAAPPDLDSNDFALLRYNPDGTLDATFGMGGAVTTPIGSGRDFAFALVRQADGKLVAAGEAFTGTFNSGNADMALVRYNDDGTLDGTFGTGGVVTTPMGSGRHVAFALVQQPDGKLVAAGGILFGAGGFVLARYGVDGMLDGTFGVGGVTPPLGAAQPATALALQPDGRLLASGGTTLVRCNPDGSVDGTFGPVAPLPGGFFGALVVQPDGKVVWAGDGGAGRGFSLARYEGGPLAVDLCPGGAAATGHTLKTARLLDPPGDDRLILRLEAILPFPSVPPLDPVANGVRLVLQDALGPTLVDAPIPAGLFDPTTQIGWKAKRAGRAWRFTSRPGTPEGITTVKVDTSRSTPGLVRLAFKGTRGRYSATAGQLPLRAEIALDPAAIQCVVATWSAAPPAPPSCGLGRNGAKLACK